MVSQAIWKSIVANAEHEQDRLVGSVLRKTDMKMYRQIQKKWNANDTKSVGRMLRLLEPDHYNNLITNQLLTKGNNYGLHALQLPPSKQCWVC
jgi:hypothetical protein